MNEKLLSKLERLTKLREQGAITQVEFDQQKAVLLRSMPNAVTPDKTKPKGRGCAMFIIGFFVFALVVGGINGLIESRKTPEEKKQDSLLAQQEAYNRAVEDANTPNATRDLEISKDAWEKGGFGSVGLHSFGVVPFSRTLYL